MKRILKKVFYIVAFSFMLIAVTSSYVSNKLLNQLKQMNEIHYENEYLSDAGVICMQLYFFNPTEENKLTCIEIEDKISNNKNELQNFTLASLYLNYLEKNKLHSKG